MALNSMCYSVDLARGHVNDLADNNTDLLLLCTHFSVCELSKPPAKRCERAPLERSTGAHNNWQGCGFWHLGEAVIVHCSALTCTPNVNTNRSSKIFHDFSTLVSPKMAITEECDKSKPIKQKISPSVLSLSLVHSHTTGSSQLKLQDVICAKTLLLSMKSSQYPGWRGWLQQKGHCLPGTMCPSALQFGHTCKWRTKERKVWPHQVQAPEVIRKNSRVSEMLKTVVH